MSLYCFPLVSLIWYVIDIYPNAWYRSRRIPRLVRIRILGSVNVEAGWMDSTTNKRKETNINSGVV